MTNRVGTILAGLLAVLAQGSVARAQAPDTMRPMPVEIFGDWMVACRPTGFCQANSLPLEDGGAGAFARIYRTVGIPPGAAEAFGTIYIPHEDVDDPSTLPEIGVQVYVTGTGGNIYGGFWVAPPPPTETRFGPLDPVRYHRASPPAGFHAAFVEAVRAGEAIGLRADDGFDDRISLRGSAAALRRMDELQGLAGTTAALVARGPAAPPARPALPPAPYPWALEVVALDPAPATPAGLPSPPEDGDCDAVAPLAWQVTDGPLLWGVCEINANTNDHYRFWRMEGDTPVAVLFPDPTVPEGATPVLPNPRLEAQDHEIRATDLGRGLGDCGTIMRWVWDADEGPVLVNYANMPVCRGIAGSAWPWLVDMIHGPDL